MAAILHNLTVLPPFTAEDPRGWYMKAEQIMRSRNFTPAQRVNSVHEALSVEQLQKIDATSLFPTPIADGEEDTNNYEELYTSTKTRIINQYLETPEYRARKYVEFCIQSSVTSDCDPLARQLRPLFDFSLEQDREDFARYVARELFLFNRPDSVRDHFLSHAPDVTNVDEVSTKVKQLSTHSVSQVAAVSARPQRQNREKRRKPKTPGYCFYHNKYGKDARNCEPGCTFQEAQTAGNDNASR